MNLQPPRTSLFPYTSLFRTLPRSGAERSGVSALYFEVQGRGRDVVLLHGWGLNLRVWDELAGALARRFRVIAIDLPGHGKSDWDTRASTPAAQTWRGDETPAPPTRSEEHTAGLPSPATLVCPLL